MHITLKMLYSFLIILGCSNESMRSGCLKGTIFLDASASQPFENKRLLIIHALTNDTTLTMTDSEGRFFVCMLRPGEYQVWTSDSSSFKKELILDENGAYAMSDNEYNVPSFVYKHIRDITVMPGDTVSTGSLALFYPESMSALGTHKK